MKIPFISPDLDVDPNIVIVGSGAILLEKEDGETIDSFNEVVRFNRAPTKGFEKHVGEKTTIRVVNQHVLACAPWRGRWSGDKQPQHFVQLQENCKIVCMGPGGHPGLLVNVHPTSTGYITDYSKVPYINGKQLTVGFAFVLLLIQTGIVPHLYGFFGEAGKEGREGLSHYWEERDNKSPCHNYSNERKILQDWHDNEKIVWHV